MNLLTHAHGCEAIKLSFGTGSAGTLVLAEHGSLTHDQLRCMLEEIIEIAKANQLSREHTVLLGHVSGWRMSLGLINTFLKMLPELAEVFGTVYLVSENVNALAFLKPSKRVMERKHDVKLYIHKGPSPKRWLVNAWETANGGSR